MVQRSKKNAGCRARERNMLMGRPFRFPGPSCSLPAAIRLRQLQKPYCDHSRCHVTGVLLPGEATHCGNKIILMLCQWISIQ